MGIYYSDKISSVFSQKIPNSKSRYDTKIRLRSGNTTCIRMIRKEDVYFDDSSSSVYIVSPIEEYRPDLIAYNCYGDETYAWVILAANNLSTVFDVHYGDKLIIPSMVSLQGTDGKMVTL